LVQIWSRNPRISEATKTTNSTVWYVGFRVDDLGCRVKFSGPREARTGRWAAGFLLGREARPSRPCWASAPRSPSTDILSPQPSCLLNPHPITQRLLNLIRGKRVPGDDCFLLRGEGRGALVEREGGQDVCHEPRLHQRCLPPHGGVPPVNQKSACLTQFTSGPCVVQIWTRNPRLSEATKPANSTVWTGRARERRLLLPIWRQNLHTLMRESLAFCVSVGSSPR